MLIMLVLMHVMIALSSIVFTAFTFFMPSKYKLRVSQALIALTLISGTYLVFTLRVNLLRVCLMGLVYTAIVSYALVLANRKLAAEEALQTRR